jgi:hypothetical protein
MRYTAMTAIKALTVISALMLNGCGPVPQKVAMGDPQVQALIRSANTFDRTSFGFSPISKDGEVRLELQPTEKYDAMLHVTSKTSRSIAYKKEKESFIWIGEQETFRGPRTFKNEDGVVNEAITLIYETEKVSGYPINQLNVTYLGEDPRLTGRRDLTLTDVKPILKEWGY